MKAKFVFEALKDVLKGRSKDEIQANFQRARSHWQNPLFKKAFDFIIKDDDPVSDAFLMVSAGYASSEQDSADYFAFKTKKTGDEWRMYSNKKFRPDEIIYSVSIEQDSGYHDDFYDFDSISYTLWEISQNVPADDL